MEAMQIPMIDAHHHLWHYHEKEYGWIGPEMEVLKRDYLPEELMGLAERSGVIGSVAVQARQTTAETRWLLGLAAANPFICGVVGWFDLRSQTLEIQLENFAAERKLVGIRHVIQDEDAGYMEESSFLSGIAALDRFGLVYDLLIYPWQLEEANRLVSRFPEQTFVLDHMAKPPVRTGAMQPWKRQMEKLARNPQVWCKISGLVTEAHHGEWNFDTLVPYMEAVTEAFGTSRLMVGSDWPVCRLEAGYDEVLAIPRRFFGGLGPEEQREIFYKNAVRCYGLEC